jgi:hypothetical protein
MTRILAAALVLTVSLPAFSQQAGAPPPPPDDNVQERPQASEMGYYESCFGVPRVGTGPFSIYGEMPIPIGSSGGSTPAPISSLPSAGNDDKAWLILAVVAVAVAPIVLYSVDSPAPRIVLQRFACPTFSLQLSGGADNGAALGSGSSGFLSTRISFGVGHVATDFQYDASPRAVSAFAGHLLVRVTPRDHVEGGLAIGYRRSVLGDRIQEGLEVGLPHQYALWRDGLRTFSLELRPMLMVGSSIEPTLEAAFLIPLAEVLHLRAGGRVYTFQGDVLWGLSAGLDITL